MSTTTPTGLTVPTSGDTPNVPADMLTLATDLDHVTVPWFASTSARDSAYAAMQFKLCVVGPNVNSGTLYVRQGSSWVELTLDSPVTSGLSWGMLTNWTMQNYAVTKRAGMVNLALELEYTGSDVTATNVGNLTNQNVLTVPAAFWPVAPFGTIPLFGWSPGSSDMQLTFVVGAAGAMNLVAGYPNATLTQNSIVRVLGTYAAA